MDSRRVVISNLRPQIESGRFPVKRVTGDTVLVQADILCDGHDALAAQLLYRMAGNNHVWEKVPMTPKGNDLWTASFAVEELGFYEYTVRAWVDHFETWRRDLRKRIDAGQDIAVELLVGARHAELAAQRAELSDREQLQEFAHFLRTDEDIQLKIPLALDDDLAEIIRRYPREDQQATADRKLKVQVDRPLARFSSWYEFFPRSFGPDGQHGTFADCERVLEDVAEMGFDIVYFPPIHPIGETQRKGKNNRPESEPDDVGSPWAIGSSEGGHKAVHPQLGTLDDFRRLVSKAKDLGIEVALDIAFQCSPDHPYVREHPEWFRSLPDGSIRHAENPPKKYEDIVPFDFETDASEALWEELKSVFLFWIEQGVHVFRVDNPHTKPFSFWEWVIGEIRAQYPDVLFLSEAFTRPKIMYRLAKLGFSQSYTYFAWRNTKAELIEYFTELTKTPAHDFFRPNAWPNTPDILTEYLQTGGRPAFMIRFLLASTLSSNYGIYGPAFESCLGAPREIGSEEYLDSEKYQLRQWDRTQTEGFRALIGRINQIRRQNPAMQSNETLKFHPVDNEQLICFSKGGGSAGELILVVVNLDPHHEHSGWLELPLEDLGIDPHEAYQVHDLVADSRFLWYGARNYIQLNPGVMPAHIFKVRRKLRTERDFEYFL
jgi:starch synthase (maltosyl-transferring)